MESDLEESAATGFAKHLTKPVDLNLLRAAMQTLLGQRGLLLVGEPGTAKSMLSELLAAAISGDSTLTIQGTAGTTEDQIKYSWNYALLLADGPKPQAMVPSPIYTGLQRWVMVRFEELTAVPRLLVSSVTSVVSSIAVGTTLAGQWILSVPASAMSLATIPACLKTSSIARVQVSEGFSLLMRLCRCATEQARYLFRTEVVANDAE